jgi:ribosome-binding protein aMBF1 (putative translation factor)
MGNDRLRAALLEAGLEIEDLAARIEVDTKTVQRWLGGRTPHARCRAKVVKLLGLQESDLWPETAPAVGLRDDRRELSDVFAHANDVRVPGWRTLMQAAPRA